MSVKNPEKKRGVGHPPHETTEKNKQLVAMMTAAGITQEEICACIGIDSKTLRKYYRRELDVSAAQANTKVAQSLFQQAINGNVTAAIWWTKSRMGWSEKNALALTGEDGGPVKYMVEVDFGNQNQG